MFPIHERATLIQNQLPDDPEDRQIVEFPEGHPVGAATVISIYKKNKLVGTTTTLSPIPNVSKKYATSRLSAVTPIREGDVLRIVGYQYAFNSVIFIQYFGWVGHQTTGEPTILSDKFYRVLAATPVGPEDKNSDFRLYEKVCLTVLEEKNE